MTLQRDGTLRSGPGERGLGVLWYAARREKQRYTVIRDGVVIDEYENAPGVHLEGRPNDPPSEARGHVGYIGLQAHGAPNDVVSFRNIRIKDLSDHI